MNKDFYKLGIIGYPLSHSISPAIQTAALHSVKLYGSYEKFEVAENELKSQIDYLRENDYSGFNVTIPHKINIIKFLDELDETAQRIGAVNTVKINPDGTLQGYNTDITGFINSILNNDCTSKNFKTAKLLGCGGAALAVIFGLEKLGCENLIISVRNIEKTHAFLEQLKNKTTIKFKIEDINNQSTLENVDILINSTPLGTKGTNENSMPTTRELLKSANKNILIYDLVYNPLQTMLLKTATDLKLSSMNGLDMLIYQGAEAFNIWTNKTPSIDLMKKAVII